MVLTMDPIYLTNLCEVSNSLLLVIDFQGKIFNLAFNHVRLKARAAQLLRLADVAQLDHLREFPYFGKVE